MCDTYRVMTTESSSSALAIACCAPLERQPLSAGDAVSIARAMKAMSDPARVRLVSIVTSSASGEVCVCDFTDPLGLSQPTVSHHLKILVDAGILHREKRGIWAYYSLIPGALGSLAELLSRV